MTAQIGVIGAGAWGTALAQSLGVAAQVHFSGRLNREQMAVLYRDAHLMLNASRVDNMPNAVLEALASGVPVISTRAGGIPFMVKDGHTAMLVAVDDAAAMAAAAIEVLENHDLRARLVAAGLVEVQRYQWSRVRDALLATYTETIGLIPKQRAT